MWGAGAAVVATAATIAAVAVVGGNPGTSGRQDPGFAAGPSHQASASPTQDTSTRTQASSPSPSDTGSQEVAAEFVVPVYYVGETARGPRLYREFHRTTAANRGEAAIAEAVTAQPQDPDYRQVWPDGTSVRAFHFDGTGDSGLITVDLAGGPASLKDRPAGMDADTAQMAVQQLVYTAQAVTQTRAPVRLLLDGQRTDSVLGVPASEPLSNGEEMSTLALVWIIDPAQDAQVTSPFTVSGLASTFEANVLWELKQNGKVVAEGHTTADEAFTMSPYSFKVQAAPGHYTLVVHDSDESGGEGFPPFEDTKQITVTD
jgi:hypothetical protein